MVLVSTRTEAEEAIEFALNEAGCVGTEINNLGKTQADETVCVIGYFDEKPDEKNLRFQISDSLRIHGLDQSALIGIKRDRVKNRDWLAEWKKHWKPTRIGRFIIAPPWEAVEEIDKIVIRIEPNMAFGTGTHETTQLCLKRIGEIYDTGQSFLDVGTGTGILAIAAAKLATENTQPGIKNLPVSSAANILACDTDADSVNIAKENAVANDVEDRIEFFHGPIDHTTPVFDLVCANLTIDVIVPILPLLISKTRSRLLLSGILVEQKNQITDALEESEISNFKFHIAGEWMSVLVDLS